MIAGESAVGGAQPASAGTCVPTGSSSPRRPSSRSSRTAVAVNDFVIEAIR